MTSTEMKVRNIQNVKHQRHDMQSLNPTAFFHNQGRQPIARKFLKKIIFFRVIYPLKMHHQVR